jgi:hypothetical protein
MVVKKIKQNEETVQSVYFVYVYSKLTLEHLMIVLSTTVDKR